MLSSLITMNALLKPIAFRQIGFGFLLSVIFHGVYAIVNIPALTARGAKLNLTIDLALFLILSYVLLRKKKSLLPTSAVPKTNGFLDFWRGFGLAIPFVVLVVITEAWLYDFEWRYWDYDLSSLSYLFFDYLGCAFLEEVIFRQILLVFFIKYINTNLRFEIAILLQALLFSASHCSTLRHTYFYIGAFFLGVFFAVIDLKKKTIWLSTGMHSGMNAIFAMITIGIEVKHFPKTAGLLRFYSAHHEPYLFWNFLLFIFSIYFWKKYSAEIKSDYKMAIGSNPHKY